MEDELKLFTDSCPERVFFPADKKLLSLRKPLPYM